MRYLFVFGIVLYQRVISWPIRLLLGTSAMCRFSPSCSEYAKESFLKYGIVKGGYLSAKRILSCQPFNLKSQMSKVKTTVQNAKVLRFTL